MKRILFTTAAILISTAAYFPAQAALAQGFSITIGNAPPPPRHEAVPAPRRGYEWVPGYWNLSGKKHRWTAGHWERARAGQHYQHPEWQQTDGGWHLNRGGWQKEQNSNNATPRDRDGDGVPNRQDNSPDNSHRR